MKNDWQTNKTSVCTSKMFIMLLLIRDSSNSYPRFYILTCVGDSQSGLHIEKWEFSDTKFELDLYIPITNLHMQLQPYIYILTKVRE
jgi:hypothetical protein